MLVNPNDRDIYIEELSRPAMLLKPQNQILVSTEVYAEGEPVHKIDLGDPGEGHPTKIG